jgi:hypothetical protein
VDEMSKMCEGILADRGLMPTGKLNKAIMRYRKFVMDNQEMLDQLLAELHKRTAEDNEFADWKNKRED